MLNTVFKLFLTISAFLALSFGGINGEVEICSDGGEVIQITNDSCPHGVLFMQPQSADCFVLAGEDESSILADVCTKDPYNPEKKTFQYIPEVSGEIIEPNSSCRVIMEPICSSKVKVVHPDSFLKYVTTADFLFADESNETNVEVVRKQTIRLFEYLMGLGKHDIDESLRVVMLLKKSFEIMKKFCPKAYLKHEFWEDVEAAFLFMLHESDIMQVRDVSSEEFETIMRHLIYCADQKSPFRFEGKLCSTYSMIQRVNKSGVLHSEFDMSNAEAFSKFDVAVEGTWGAIDFVHGLCYGTFKDHINSHHLYQRALERLFTREVLYRWQHRFIFQDHQHIWNNFFSANVKNALMNMDICVQSSYLSTPFLHRLERPIDAGGPKPTTQTEEGRRKKRWAEPHALRFIEQVEGYCFQTKEEADEALGSLCD